MGTLVFRAVKGSALSIAEADGNVTELAARAAACEQSANKDISGGYVGRTGWSLNFTNDAGSFVSFLHNTNTAARTYLFPDASGTVALLSDLSGKAASGANSDISSLSSPALANATANTQTAGDNSTKVATTAFVAGAVSAATSVPLNWCGNATGTANALALTPAVAITSYSASVGKAFLFVAASTNTTSAPTIAISGLAPLATTMGSVAPPAGGIIAGNMYICIIESATSIRVAPFDALSVNGDTMNGRLDFAKSGNLASAATVDLTTATGNLVHITGTTTITAMTTNSGQRLTVVFDGALTLTNGANLILPGGANIATAAGDAAEIWGDGAGVARVTDYLRAGSMPLLASAIGSTVQAYDAQLSSKIPQNSQSANYTLALTDGEGEVFHPTADTTARTWTIPANASVAFPVGTCVLLTGQSGSGVITLSITTDTLRWVPSGTTGSRTLTAPFMAVAKKITPSEWNISGVGVS